MQILDRFRRGETRALIGTQMLSKGHHFPNVTLTGVLNADSILGYPDFRSAEKTFYLLTQVAGRAGRGELRGKVMIQTAFPSHYAIQHALRHDYESFYEAEIQFRRTFHYPPVTSMIALLFRGENLADVDRAASDCGRLLEDAVQPLDGHAHPGTGRRAARADQGRVALPDPSALAACAPRCAKRWSPCCCRGSGRAWKWRSTWIRSTFCRGGGPMAT